MKTLTFCLGVALLAAPGEVRACSSAQPVAKETFRSSDVVFIGTVVGIRRMGRAERFHDESVVVKFAVFDQWKGSATDTMELYSFDFVQPCSDEKFTVGQTYIIYGKEYEAKNWLDGIDPTFLRTDLPMPDEKVLVIVHDGMTKDLTAAIAEGDIRALGRARYGGHYSK